MLAVFAFLSASRRILRRGVIPTTAIIVVTLLSFGVLTNSPTLASHRGALTAQLVQLQAQSGLTIGWAEKYGIEYVDFAARTTSSLSTTHRPDSSILVGVSSTADQFAFLTPFPGIFHLRVLRSDGTALKEYPTIRSAVMCWSPHRSLIAMQIANVPPAPAVEPFLAIFDPDSGKSTAIANDSLVTAQCWSPNSQEVVYGSNGSVWIYDTETNKARKLTDGQWPTWSPDGKWIAFVRGDAFYEIHPDGSGLRLFFARKNPASGLLWSPDSKLVAYSSQAGFFEGQWRIIDVEVYRLRVRRLDDGSEYSIDRNVSGLGIQWMENPQFKTPDRKK